MSKKICSICGCEYKGYGNNAWPVNEGTCCDACDSIYVVPRRIYDIMEKQANETKILSDSEQQ